MRNTKLGYYESRIESSNSATRTKWGVVREIDGGQAPNVCYDVIVNNERIQDLLLYCELL